MVLIVVSWLSLTSAHYSFDSSKYPAQDVITRDVCIIGGGSSGTYAAIRLHGLGKSVVVVERKDRLGGHTETYIDPATQLPTDIGVQYWTNLDIVKNYFARLNVSYFLANSSISAVTYVDLSTGKLLPTFSPPDPTAALSAYAAQLAKYPYLNSGFDLPSPVPEDLLLPFGQFVTKYALQDIVYFLATYSQGIGDLLAKPTLYVMKLNGLDLLNSLQVGLILTTSRDNSELYQKAQGILGPDNVLFRSHIVAIDRSSIDEDGYVKVLVKTSNGGLTKLIRAKKIVVSIPPKLSNLVGFDLSAQEAALFAQFGNAFYYTCLVRNAGINSSLSVFNAGENTTYNLPVLPGAYAIYPSGVPNLTHVFYGSSYELSPDQVKANIISTLLRLQRTENITTTTTTQSFPIFSSHVPFEMNVPVSAIAGGYYRELNDLQGQRGTYYTGAAFQTHSSALLWQFTEGLLPAIVG